MADYTLPGGLRLQFNGGASATGTDASPVWTGTAVNFNTSNHELRFCNSGGGTSIASASWPYITKPNSGTAAVTSCYAYTADATGLQVTTYTGDNTKANVYRWDWDTSGTQNSAPQFSLFGSTAHSTPTGGDNSVVGGNSSDTSSTSYMKINAYGAFTTTDLSAGSVGTAPTATTGGGGAKTCTASDWLNTHVAWNDAQGWTNYIVLNSTPTATTAGDWHWTAVLFVGVNLVTGTLQPVFTFQYTYV